MKEFFYDLAFHRGGRPRKWLIFVLFREGMVARPLFRRLVHKKNGTIRPRYAYWVKQLGKGAAGSALIESLVQDTRDNMRPEEYQLQALPTFEETVGRWRGKPNPKTLLDADAVMAALSPTATDTARRLIFCVSHDNYIRVIGGVQLCIQREQRIAVSAGYNYLQLHPWHPRPRLAHVAEEPDTIVAMILNGKEIGACRMSVVIETGRRIAQSTGGSSVVVHHLLGHLPEQITELVQAAQAEKCVFWLHDFFSICPSYTLQRNNLRFCGAPAVTSNACNLCVYGPERVEHQARMADFFAATTPEVASPSEVTAQFWQRKAGLKARFVAVLPHMVIDVVPESSVDHPKGERPIVVGYLGAPAQHKGWGVFTRLLQMHAGSITYRFVVLSHKRPLVGEDDWRSVHVTADNPDAMSDSVRAADVDLVLHWPTWPETFSFTTFEALVGSGYVVTHQDSGNVAAAVAETGRGVVLGSEAELEAFMQDGRAKALAERRRADVLATTVVQRHSDMSLPLIRKN